MRSFPVPKYREGGYDRRLHVWGGGGGGGGIKKPKILIECMKVNQNLYLEEGVKLKSLPWEGYGYFLGE